MASKFFPLRVRRCCCESGASRLISFSEGGGEPSTHHFHPFFTATLFLRGGAGNGADWLPDWELITSSSAGVRGLLDKIRDVLDEIEGSGVEPGVESRGCREDVGEGVTDTEHWMAGIWIVGLARQNKEVAAGARVLIRVSEKCCFVKSSCRSFWTVSLSFTSLICPSCASSSLSTALQGPTPSNRLVKTSLGGQISKQC